MAKKSKKLGKKRMSAQELKRVKGGGGGAYISSAGRTASVGIRKVGGGAAACCYGRGIQPIGDDLRSKGGAAACCYGRGIVPITDSAYKK